MSIQERPILNFWFAIIDLARLDARQYVRRLNAAAMALSARMRVNPGSKVNLAVDFIRNIVRGEWAPKELDAVSGFFFAYQEFAGEEGLKLRRELSIIQNMRLSRMLPKEVLLRNPPVRIGIDEGRREGQRQGETELILRLLKHRSGPVTARQERAIRKLPIARVEALAKALLDFLSPRDLSHWLRSHAN